MNPWEQIGSSLLSGWLGNVFGDKSGNYPMWAMQQAMQYLWPSMAKQSQLFPQLLGDYQELINGAKRDMSAPLSDLTPQYTAARDRLDREGMAQQASLQRGLAARGMSQSSGGLRAMGGLAGQLSVGRADIIRRINEAQQAERLRRQSRYQALLSGGAGLFDPTSRLASMSQGFAAQNLQQQQMGGQLGEALGGIDWSGLFNRNRGGSDGYQGSRRWVDGVGWVPWTG